MTITALKIPKRLLLVMGFFFLASCSPIEKVDVESTEITIVKELKIAALQDKKNNDKIYEASGVSYVGDDFYIVFDNTSKVAKVNRQLNTLKFLGEKRKNLGFEGIAFNRVDNNFYRLEEAAKNKGRLNARLHSSDKKFANKSNKSWFRYNLQFINKGMEGLAWLQYKGKDFLLVLCEGNDCDSGIISKNPGGGRIKVFEHGRNKWLYIASIRLPIDLNFIDFSGMDINENHRLAIVSQESSALWLADLDVENWQLTQKGKVYRFPQSDEGETVYCNLEGVAWINDQQLLVVSDARKAVQPASCREKDQSIHWVSVGNV